MKRGSALIVTLLMCALLLVAGGTLLAARAGTYRGVKASALSATARELAMAGLEETRVRLVHDYNFPPQAAEDQPEYQVVEQVLAPDGVEVAGYYMVRLEVSHKYDPYRFIEVESLGLVGSLTEPRARRLLRATLDLRGDAASNPTFFRWLRIVDEGSL